MKICTTKHISSCGEQLRMGIILSEDLILDPNLLWQTYYREVGHYNWQERANHKCPHLLSDLLRLADEPLALLNETLDIYNKIQAENYLFTYGLIDGISITAPIDKIPTYRDFYTHEKHVEVGFKKRNEPIPPAWYEIPAYYKGATAGFIGHEDEVLWPSYSEKLDYELELAAVIGRDGINISEKEAYKSIFGFTILNDISARDIQKKEMSVRLGPAKGKDFCSVIGPVITTIDEFNFSEPEVEMIAKVNGDEWSRGKSNDANYTFAQMINHAAKDEWLLAGDLIGSGTVGTGCGLELDKWIQPGDLIELKVEKIGTLKNRIGKPRKA